MKKDRILVIEGENDLRNRTVSLLKLAGYDVIEASTGKLGVEQASIFLPDLILCSIALSDIDGYMVLSLIRKLPQTQTIPFIFVTSKNDRKEVRKGMAMGADDYLTRPYQHIELLETIEMRLRKKSEQIKARSPVNNLENFTNGIEYFEKITNESRLRHFKQKQVIYYQEDLADSIYLIATGSVKTIKTTADGHDLVTGIYGENEYFGITPYFSEEVYHETAEAIEESSVYTFSRGVLDPLIDRFPDLSKKFAKILAGYTLQNELRLLEFAYFSVRKRMSQLLLRLRPHQSGNTNHWIEISRENLAAMSGMAIETVSRVLSDFKNDGLIARDSNRIVIIDPMRLEDLKN